MRKHLRTKLFKTKYLKTLWTHLKMTREAWRQLRKNNAYVAPAFKLPTTGLYDDVLLAAQAHFLKMRWDQHRRCPTRDNMIRFIQGAASIRSLAAQLAKEPTRYDKFTEEEWFNILTGWQLKADFKWQDPLDQMPLSGQSPF